MRLIQIAVYSAIAFALILMSPTASAQTHAAATAESSTVLSSDSDDAPATESGGSSTKWILISAGAGLALGGVIAGVQAIRRKKDEPKNPRYRR